MGGVTSSDLNRYYSVSLFDFEGRGTRRLQYLGLFPRERGLDSNNLKFVAFKDGSCVPRPK